MSHRPEQLASSIHHAVQQVLAKGLSDPRVSGLITITSVKVSKDLRDATILFSVLPEDRQDLTLHGLRNAERHIRRQAGELIDIRQLPAFHFKLDASPKKQAAVLESLERVREEHNSPSAPGFSATPKPDPDRGASH